MKKPPNYTGGEGKLKRVEYDFFLSGLFSFSAATSRKGPYDRLGKKGKDNDRGKKST